MDPDAVKSEAAIHYKRLCDRIDLERARNGGLPLDEDVKRLLVLEATAGLHPAVITEMAGPSEDPDQDIYILAGQCVAAREMWHRCSDQTQAEVSKLEAREDVAGVIRQIHEFAAFKNRAIN